MKYPGQEMIGRNVRGTVESNPAGRVALELKEIEPIINSDPLHQFSEKELQLLRQYRVRLEWAIFLHLFEKLCCWSNQL